ncbi:related to alpha--mannosyltransferase alg2 [Ceraceosorus bombacis]|uniref:Alpha-1,3/1,6-mannosyltransferase ALG2 n=1 Tax=Ceraceosorus bombacis TaxID=401625 RepID=A0A0N7LA36_9BASI|nr:related to alpha--mannosyltransferase alg2 [Ceraceosorus bombacis]
MVSIYQGDRCPQPMLTLLILSWHEGTLVVRHVKTSIPRAVFNSFHLPLAIAQQFSLFFQLCIALLCFRFPGAIPKGVYSFLSSTKPIEPYDLIFVDQLSAIVPWIRHVTATRVVFYCHYPDKEISNSIARQRAIERGEGGPGLLRALYRIPFDLYEEATMGSSDKVLVNSIFTQKQFVKSFSRLRREPRVLYPGIDLSLYSAANAKKGVEDLGALGTTFSVKNAIRNICTGSSDHVTLVSINRFEAKKNISLAIEAFAKVLQEEKKKEKPRPLRLVIAGGHDRRLRDNVATLDELQAQAARLKLNCTTLFWTPQPFEPPASAPPPNQLHALQVVFLPSLPGALLPSLLLAPTTRALLYTPPDEHFGIVPLEAMACGVPVLAANSGGPVESIVDAGASDEGGNFSNPEGTGLLRAPRAQTWAPAITSLLDMSDSQRAKMARAAVERVKSRFSLQVMTDGLEKALFDTDAQGPLNNAEGLLLWGSTLTIFAFTMALYLYKRFSQ